jgi:hypothetical protein
MTDNIQNTEPAENKPVTRRQAILIGAGIVATVTGGTYLAVARPWETSTTTKETPVLSYDLSDEDKQAITTMLTNFITQAGNFGVDGSKLTPATIRNVRYLVKSRTKGYENYMRTRTDAYKSVRASIWEGSPIYYKADDVAHWNKESYLLDERLPTFQIEGTPKVYVEPKGEYYIGGNDTTYRKAAAQVDFTSKETVRVQEADGVGSDGGFTVLTKEHVATLTIEIIESNGKWYAYNQSGNKQYLLATWANFDSAAYADSQVDGFTKEGRIVPTDN